MQAVFGPTPTDLAKPLATHGVATSVHNHSFGRFPTWAKRDNEKTLGPHSGKPKARWAIQTTKALQDLVGKMSAS